MLNFNQAFLDAVRARKRQILRLDFGSEEMLTGEDVSSNGGLTWDDMLNGSDAIEMGKATMNSLNLSLINDGGRLTDFDFAREFTAYIGVETATSSYSGGSTMPQAVTYYSNAVIYANPLDSTGTIHVYYDSTVTDYLAGARVDALMMVANALYAVNSTSGVIKKYTLTNGVLTEATLPTFGTLMTAKLKGWAFSHRNLSIGSTANLVYEHKASGNNVSRTTYTCAKLGTFIGNKPSKTASTEIQVEAYDRMQLFEKDANEFLTGLTYPKTLRELFVALCDYVGIGYVTNQMLNTTRSFAEAPLATENATLRDVLALIAEAAGGYAVIDRDGYCKIKWYTDCTSSLFALEPTDIFSLDEAEYEVPRITKLKVQSDTTDMGTIFPADSSAVGTGTQTAFFLPHWTWNTPTVTVDDVEQIEGTDFTYNNLSKRVSFTTAPANEAVIEFLASETNTNGYVICDNPYLMITESVVTDPTKTHINNLLERLTKLAPYRPVTVDAEGFWALETGDIIRIKRGNVYHNFPVMGLSLTWAGYARMTITCTGEGEERVMNASNRTLIATAKRIYEMKQGVEGMSSRVTAVENGLTTAESRITQTESDIGLVVESRSGDKVIKAGSIMAAINDDESQVTINADKVNLEGYVTMTALEEEGSTEINGANITTGTISASRIDADNLIARTIQTNGGWFGEAYATMTTYSDSTSSGSETKSWKLLEITTSDTSSGICFGAHWYVKNGSILRYNEICMVPETHLTGNIGVPSRAWDYMCSEEYGKPSSRNVKTNIESAEDVCKNFDALETVKFVYKDDPKKRVTVGLIAEDVVDIYPECVRKDENGDPVSIDYTMLVIPLINEMQRLKKRVSELEAKIEGKEAEE